MFYLPIFRLDISRLKFAKKSVYPKHRFLEAKSYISDSFLCAKMKENRRKRIMTTVSQRAYEIAVSLSTCPPKGGDHGEDEMAENQYFSAAPPAKKYVFHIRMFGLTDFSVVFLC